MKVHDYEIKWSEKQNRWTCTCPDYKFRKSKEPQGQCKHIESVVTVTVTDDPRYKPRSYFESVADTLRGLGKEFELFEIAGSYRRQKKVLKDLDVVVFVNGRSQFESLIESIKLIGYIENGKDQRVTAIIDNIQVDFRIVYSRGSWNTSLLHFTGSKDENIRLRRIALSRNMRLNEYALEKDGKPLPCMDERDVYAYLGEQYKEPWER